MRIYSEQKAICNSDYIQCDKKTNKHLGTDKLEMSGFSQGSWVALEMQNLAQHHLCLEPKKAHKPFKPFKVFIHILSEGKYKDISAPPKCAESGVVPSSAESQDS